MATFEIRLGHKTGLVAVSPTQGQYVATVYWFPDGRILRAPGEAGSTTLQQHHVYGATQDEALEALRSWTIDQFTSVGNFCEGRE